MSERGKQKHVMPNPFWHKVNLVCFWVSIGFLIFGVVGLFAIHYPYYGSAKPGLLVWAGVIGAFIAGDRLLKYGEDKRKVEEERTDDKTKGEE